MDKYIVSKIDNKEYCKANGQFSRHLKSYGLSYQNYYETYVTGIIEVCKYCSSPKSFYQSSHTYATTCGSKICVGKEVSNTKQHWTEEQRISDSKHKKQALANRSPAEVKAIFDKIKQTCLIKYGVEHTTQSSKIKQKSKQTKLEKYGNEFYSGWEKSAEKNRNKSVEEQDIINNKRRRTNKERFGVENVFLRPGNAPRVNRGNSSIKDYVLPSGKTIGVKGYEPYALDILFNQGYAESDIIVHNNRSDYCIEIFEYITHRCKIGKYYPDIYITKENKIIEVKSQWWYDGNGDPRYSGRLINNKRKRQAVLDKGYKYEVWVFTNKTDYDII